MYNDSKELSGKASDNRTLHQLQIELRGRLTQKKFLLILDDVWNESDREWDLLQTPLKYGAKGSKIIATTRHLNVASVMSTTDTYHLNPLTSDDCWMIFSSCASLVEKCQGLPLAARTLGALLHTEQDVEKWEKILKSNLWDLHDEILPALILSYQYLPSYLKQCFAYCAIFPKEDLKIYRCPDLMAIPEEGLPSSLSSMSILRCPFLEQRCQQDKGEDWSKISHIPNLEIGHYNI
ncbi:unnamed protein product [Linum tenue]|uniref:NB-ARC domain-containing protein n=1 Tax=Linum tenue TaxID=586396 RepID=A0AAV0NTQ1_9ROSI|nr:unnamed protein product [Linum tenue]